MISVIIPVYNTPIEDLQRCFNSIIVQTYADWEAVIIDDGSCKAVYDELDDWALADARFRVVHQKNSGVSVARNIGIRNSLGEYIAFCDADDCLKENFMFEALQYLNEYNLDLIIGACEIIDGENIKRYKCASNNEKPWIFGVDEKKGLNTFLDYMISAHNKAENCELYNCLIGRVYCKLFQKKLVEDICFKQNIKMHEDNLFSIEALCTGKAVGVVENVWYEYYMNPYSAIHENTSRESIEDEFLFAKELYQYRRKDLKNAVDVRMIWIMKAICSILRKDENLKNMRKNVLKQMMKEEYFIVAVENFDLSGYWNISYAEKCFAMILRQPQIIRYLLLCMWVSVLCG